MRAVEERRRRDCRPEKEGLWKTIRRDSALGVGEE